MLVVDQNLPGRFVVRVGAVTKHLSVANQERQRHEHTVGPKLPLTAGRIRMPEPAIFRPWISIKDRANILRGELVLFLLRLLVENQQQVAGQHVIERVDRTIDCALVIDVKVDPGFDVIQVSFVVRSQIDEILAIEIKRLRITPALE